MPRRGCRKDRVLVIKEQRESQCTKVFVFEHKMYEIIRNRQYCQSGNPEGNAHRCPPILAAPDDPLPPILATADGLLPQSWPFPTALTLRSWPFPLPTNPGPSTPSAHQSWPPPTASCPPTPAAPRQPLTLRSRSLPTLSAHHSRPLDALRPTNPGPALLPPALPMQMPEAGQRIEQRSDMHALDDTLIAEQLL